MNHSKRSLFIAALFCSLFVFLALPSFSQVELGDLNGDRVVDQSDLLLFMREWYVQLSGSPADFNQDGFVSEDDLFVFSSHWYDNKGIELIPHIASVVEEDTQLFAILDPQEHTTNWKYSVNGVEGGDASVGTFQASEASPLFGLYSAPDLSDAQPIEVVLEVRHATDTSASATAAVTIVPRFGEFIIQPNNADVGLKQTVTFQAGIEFDSVFYPINDVYWKVNETLGGQFQTGRINILGDYKAPAIMPAPLPFDVNVGFSFTPEGAIITDVPVLISELHATPQSVVSLEAGPTEIINVTVEKSNDTIVPVGPANLTFTPSLPDVATVDANGTIIIGDKLGDCVILVDDNATGARDTVVARSRTDYDLKAEIEPRSPQFFRVERVNEEVIEVEYTNPGAMFNFVPVATILRGDHAGDKLTATSSHLTFSSSSEKVAVIGDDDPFPDLEGLIAVMHKDKGFVVVGQEPGRATLVADFDYAYAKHQVKMDVIFSRIEVNATAKGHITQSTSELLITEYIQVAVQCTNPNSEFFGDVPLQVKVLNQAGDPAPFEAAFHRNRHTGNGAIKGEFNNFFPFQFSQYDLFNLTADSSARPEAFVESPGEYEFFVVPRQAGMHHIEFTVRDDPGVEPVIISVNVVKPKMVLQHPPAQFSNEQNFVPDDIKVPVNSWVNVFHRHPDSAVSPFDLVQEAQGNTFTRFAHNDVVIWNVTDPTGENSTFPITDLFNSSTVYRGGTFNRPFDIQGEWKVKHGLKEHPVIETEELTVNVVHPADVESVASENIKPVTDEDNEQLVPRSNQMGAFEIVAPIGGGWAPGIPIPVVIQTYDANGTAKTVGKSIQSQFFSNTSEGLRLTRESVEQRVVGVSVNFLRNFNFFVNGSLMPNSQGVISFNIVPTESAINNIGDDLIVQIAPTVYSIFAEDQLLTSLPVETRRFVDGDGGVLAAAPFGITEFIQEQDMLFNKQCLFVSGNALAASPRQLPVPSERVRNAVAAGKLPEASKYTTLALHGNNRFNTSIGSGITAISYSSDPGVTSGLTIKESKKIADRQMQVTVDLQFQDTGERFFKVVTGDGKEWEVATEFVEFEVSDPGFVNHSDKNLPLNARHHNAHEVGSQQFDVQNKSRSAVLHMLELELLPSIKTGDQFRGQEAQSPLVGFETERDEETQQTVISTLKQKFFQRNFSAFMVFGNTTDRKTLNPQGSQLMAQSGPDGLPDFVSSTTDAEKILVSLSGNLGDYYEFTAYNLVTKVTQDLQDPGVGFDDIKGNISSTWTKYSGPDSSQSIQSVGNQLTTQKVSIQVDKEATTSNLNSSSQLIQGDVPTKYFAGVLDQYYLSKKIYSIGSTPRTVSIAKDSRVRAFNGERSGSLLVTPFERRGFGVELDGVIYDPKLDAVFDLPPNSPDMLKLPVVSQWTNGGMLSDRGLVPEHGGTSGGYFDLNKEYPGSHQVVSKTPGQQFPGLHAGYLVQNTTAFLTDPYLGDDDDPSIEDDIEEVIIKRSGGAGTAIEEEKKFFKLFGQTTQLRRVNGFAQARDKSDPITTSLFSTHKYQVATDPPGLEESVPVVASVWLRELPRTPEENVNLLVSTQSFGNEHLQKAAIDFVVDMTVNLSAQVILAALTGGAGNALCGGLDVAGTFTTASISFSLSSAESEFFANQLDASTSKPFHVANSVLRSGQSFVPYVDSIQVSAGDFIEFPELKELKEKGFRGLAAEARSGLVKAPGKIANVGVCAILNAPFEALKDALKESVSVEGLGGAGSAQAIAERYLCVSVPQSAWRDEGGLFSAEYSLRRVIDVIPDEPAVRNLQIPEAGEEEDDDEDGGNLPIEYKTDSAIEDDVALIARLLTDLSDPDKKDDAEKVLNRMSVNSVSRKSNAHDNIFREHKLRYGRLPMFEVIMTPKGELEPGKTLGDFMLRTDETAIDVSTGSMVMASRTNENAGSRAVLTSNGYQMQLLNATIPDPFQARRPTAFTAQGLHHDESLHSCGLSGQTQYQE
ncbi:MAG: hypothetical protein P9L94_09465 [Candidatus Hinthialibacter antarcticus]|nr:hypothetical protein [Candidatus Hinthialibacter antarcticus]